MPDPDPLILECVCEEDAICALTGMRVLWDLHIANTGGGIELAHGLTVHAGAASESIFSTESSSTSGSHELDLDTWLPLLNSMLFTFTMNSSLLQLGGTNVFTESVLKVQVEYEFDCGDEEHHLLFLAYPTDPDGCVCWVNEETGQLRSVLRVTGGNPLNPFALFRGLTFVTDPFAECSGCAVTSGNLFPPPNGIIVADSQCLCASGGTPPYSFRLLQGRLKNGLGFNTTTGCPEGSGDGGGTNTPTVTFVVYDSGDPVQTAITSCAYVEPCPGDDDANIGNETA